MIFTNISASFSFLQEQRLLLEDMVEQEKREQANQLQQVGDMPPNQIMMNDQVSANHEQRHDRKCTKHAASLSQGYEQMLNNPQQGVGGRLAQQQAGMVTAQHSQTQQLQSPVMHQQLQMQSPNNGQFMIQQQQQQQQPRMAPQWRQQARGGLINQINTPLLYRRVTNRC